MRHLIAAACLLVAASSAAAQDASGTWQATFNTQNGPRPATLVLKKSGETLTGVLKRDEGDLDISGTQKGADITLAVVVPTNNGPINVTMRGAQNGDAITGTADYGGTGSGEWSAKRTAAGAPATPAEQSKGAADVSGAWALQVETPQGSGSPRVTFKQDGEKLTGHYVGQFGESAVAGTIKGRDITWSVELTVEGTPFRVVYTGTVDGAAGASMKGTVNFGDVAEGTFTGKRQ